MRVIDYDDEDLMLISYNKRVKSKEEKDREILFVRDYVVKPPKMGRPTKTPRKTKRFSKKTN